MPIRVSFWITSITVPIGLLRVPHARHERSAKAGTTRAKRKAGIALRAPCALSIESRPQGLKIRARQARSRPSHPPLFGCSLLMIGSVPKAIPELDAGTSALIGYRIGKSAANILLRLLSQTAPCTEASRSSRSGAVLGRGNHLFLIDVHSTNWIFCHLFLLLFHQHQLKSLFLVSNSSLLISPRA